MAPARSVHPDRRDAYVRPSGSYANLRDLDVVFEKASCHKMCIILSGNSTSVRTRKKTPYKHLHTHWNT